MASPASPSTPTATTPLPMHVNVQTVFGQTVSVVVPQNGDVSLLKDAIAAKLNIDSEHQHVLFAGRELDQLAASLESVGLRDGSTVTVTPVAKSGPINYRNVPWPGRAALAPRSPRSGGAAAAAGVVVGDEERRLLRAVLRTMSAEARAQVLESSKPVTIAAIVDQALVVISIPPGELTPADLEGLDDEPAPAAPAPAETPSARTPDVDFEAANAAMRAKVERLKEQMRLKKLARQAGSAAAAAAPAPAQEAPPATVAAPTPRAAAAVGAPSAAGKRAASPARTPSPTPFAGLRRGFLLSPRASPPPPPRPSGASTPTAVDAVRAAARRARSSTVGAPSRPPGSVTPAAASGASGFAGLRRGFLLRPAAAPKRSQTVATLAEFQRRDKDADADVNANAATTPALSPTTPAAPMDVDVAPTAPAAPAPPRPTCDHCHRKLGLAAAFDCRCGHRFCARHRFPEDHACQFDHRAAGRQQLMDANPMVVAPKVNKW